MMSREQPLEQTHMEQAVQLVAYLLDEVQRQKISRVQFELSEDQVRVELPEGVPAPEFQQAPGLGAQVINYFVERTFYWPDPDDEVMASNSGKTKRLYFSAPCPFAVMADVTMNRKIGTNNTLVTLSNFKSQGLRSVEDYLHFNKNYQGAFSRFVSPATGLVLASTSTQANRLDACALLLARRPDAIFIRRIADEQTALSALRLAERHLVVVGFQGHDSVEATLNFLGTFGSVQENVDAAVRVLHGTFVHAFARRVCHACAKSTPVDSRTIDKIPMALRSGIKSTYMFGRGCEQCGHSAYRGLVGMSSVVLWNDTMRRTFQKAGDLTSLTREAYGHGTRSFLEDGLAKIFAGQTSFEEVFSFASQISSAFAAAISAQTNGKGSRDVGKLEALDDDTFLAKYDQSVTANRSSSKPSVMIIEDDSDQRVVLGSVFENDGYEVTTVEDGKTAFEQLKQKPVDVIVCDLMMPIMNGAQLVKLLKESPTLKNIPIMMLTAVCNADAEVALLKQGADDYCEKNVKKKVLLKRVERLLGKRKKNPLEHMLAD